MNYVKAQQTPRQKDKPFWKTASTKKFKQYFPQEGSAGPDIIQERCTKLHIPGGSWKGTGIPSCTDDPSGRSILVLRESRTFSSMLLRKLVLLFSKITETVTWLSFWRFPWISYVCKWRKHHREDSEASHSRASEQNTLSEHGKLRREGDSVQL